MQLSKQVGVAITYNYYFVSYNRTVVCILQKNVSSFETNIFWFILNISDVVLVFKSHSISIILLREKVTICKTF